MSTLVLAPPLERALLHVAKDEGLIEADSRFWQQRFTEEPSIIDAAMRANLFANIFLHPEVKLGVRYEVEVPTRTERTPPIAAALPGR